MTEDEAATKACFFGAGPGRAVPCLGSKCMAWRWEGPVMHFEDTLKDAPRPEGDGWELVGPVVSYGGPIITRYRRINPERSGHCGLVGAPEYE